MSNIVEPAEPPSEAGIIYEKKLQRRGQPPDPTNPDLIFYVMLAMLLVKLAVILFGNTK